MILQCVIYKSLKICHCVLEGVEQVDFVAEEVEIRRLKGAPWLSNIFAETMWADVSCRLWRRIMRPCGNDLDILETLCYADEYTARVTALFSVNQNIPYHQTASAQSC